MVLPYWRRLVLVLALSLASTVTALWVPLLSRDIVDGALLARNPSRLFTTVGLFAIVSIATFVLNTVCGLRYTRVSADILFDMRLEMYRHLQRLSPRFYARTRIGDIMSRINNDIGELQRIAAETALGWFGNVLFLAGTIGMLAWLDLRLFLVAVMTAPPAIWALVYYQRRVEERVRVVRERSADIGSFLIDTIQGMRLVVSANAQAREEARFRSGNDSFVARADADAAADVFLRRHARVDPVGRHVDGLPVRRAAGDRRHAHVRDLHRLHDVSDAVPVAAAGADGDVWQPRDRASVAAPRLGGARRAGRREGSGGRRSRWRRPRGEVSFDRVSLSFGRGEAVLDRVSFTVKPGETLAIVGPSGSGKSTIADLHRAAARSRQRQRPARRPRPQVDRAERSAPPRRASSISSRSSCTPRSRRTSATRVPARPTPTSSMRRARASLDRFVRRLPDGYQTVVGERGAALSVGERQRLALARAFLADPTVLVLDEPSSALDVHAEQRIAAGYERVMRGRTTIVITHRAELAARADRVLSLEPELACVS